MFIPFGARHRSLEIQVTLWRTLTIDWECIISWVFWAWRYTKNFRQHWGIKMTPNKHIVCYACFSTTSPLSFTKGEGNQEIGQLNWNCCELLKCNLLLWPSFWTAFLWFTHAPNSILKCKSGVHFSDKQNPFQHTLLWARALFTSSKCTSISVVCSDWKKLFRVLCGERSFPALATRGPFTGDARGCIMPVLCHWATASFWSCFFDC